MQLVSVGAGSAAEGGGGEEDQDHEERGGGGLAGRKCCTCLQYTQNISETPFETSKRTIYFKQFMYLSIFRHVAYYHVLCARALVGHNIVQ